MTIPNFCQRHSDFRGQHFDTAVCQPSHPCAVVLNFLHRNSDGWVPFARQVDGDWQALGNIRAPQVAGMLSDETNAGVFQTDSYFGLHGMYGPGPYRTHDSLPYLEPALRNVDSVRYLTCCHVDLDGYKLGLDTAAMITEIMRLVNEGTLPQPSVFLLSRGLWALWRIHDKLKVDEPLRNHPSHVMDRWRHVQTALTRTCAPLGSDTATTHAATVTRIPGSVNSKDGRPVRYVLPTDLQGNPFSYTLIELEAFTRPRFFKAPKPNAGDFKPDQQNRSKRGLKGWHGRWKHLLRSLGRLRDIRGGWKVGTRSKALFYVAMALRGMGVPRRDAMAVLAEHLSHMEQPSGDRLQMRYALRIYSSLKRLRGGGARNGTVADALDVSPSEATLLSDGRSKRFPPASRHGLLGLPESSPIPQKVTSERRRDAVRAICDELLASGIAPDGAIVQGQLITRGLAASRATVLSDMRAIGCPSQRAHADQKRSRRPGGPQRQRDRANTTGPRKAPTVVF